MAEENTQQEQTKQQAEPTVNVDEIVSKVTQAASKQIEEATSASAKKTADEVSRKITERLGKAILGEKQKTHNEEALEMVVTDPVKTLAATKGVAVKESVDTMLGIIAAREVKAEVLGEFTSEYPELKSKSKQKIVEALVQSKRDSGKSFEDAYRESCKEVVSEFGLKSVKEAQREKGYSLSTPSGGGRSAPSDTKEKDAKASALSFISEMRAKANALRNRK